MKRNIVGLLLILLTVITMVGINTTPVFAWQAVYSPAALDSMSDLITPTSTRKYPLGATVTIYDSAKNAAKEFVYVRARVALTAYRTYVINVSSFTSGDYQVAVATQSSTAATGANATATGLSSANAKIVCIPQVAFTQKYYGFVQTGGDCTAYCISGSTIGTMGKIVSGATSALGITGESATAGTAETLSTVGVSKATRGGSGTTAYFLIGKGKRALISN